MSKRRWLQTYKQNGVVQRSDVVLNKAIANALIQRVLSGEALFHDGRGLSLSIPDGDTEKTIVIPRGTLNAWITRDTVIPETGETLRGILDKARMEHRIKERERRKDMLIETAERKLGRALNLRTKVPVVGMFGKVIDKDTGQIIRKEDAGLLRIQTDAAKFVLEHLDADRYGRKPKEADKQPAVFSLSDLRRASEAIDAEKEMGNQ